MLKLTLKKAFAPDLSDEQREHMSKWLNQQLAELDKPDGYPSIQFFYYLDYLHKTDAIDDRPLAIIKKKFGKRFQEKRNGLKISQAELARHIGVDTSVIGHLERGAGTIANYGAFLIALEFYQLIKGKRDVIREFQETISQFENQALNKEMATL
jgi:DNA-binding XRE family transcriptional regulator